MSKTGYYGDFESMADEQRAYDEYMERQEEEDAQVVPCFKCGGQMYQESNDPIENICEKCNNLK